MQPPAAFFMASKCVHKGCGKVFDDPEELCIYHPGPPVFHEGQKGKESPGRCQRSALRWNMGQPLSNGGNSMSRVEMLQASCLDLR